MKKLIVLCAILYSVSGVAKCQNIDSLKTIGSEDYNSTVDGNYYRTHPEPTRMFGIDYIPETYLLGFSSYLAAPFERHPFTIKATYSRQTAGKRLWEAQHQFPIVGFNFTYLDLGNPTELGKVFAFATVQDYKLKKFSYNRGLRFVCEPGLSYSTQKFTIENQRYIPIGTKVNFYVNFGLNYNFFIGNIENSFGLNVSHFSNGNFHEPNLGVNIAGFKFGLKLRTFNSAKFLEKAAIKESAYEENKKFVPKKIFLALNMALAQKTYAAIGPNYYCTTVSFWASRMYSPVSSIGLGVDYFTDYGITNATDFIISDTSNLNKPKVQNKRLGVMIAYELWFGRVSVPLNIGVYAISPDNLGSYWRYNRIGLKYHFHKNFFISGCIKAHGGTADYVEFGIGTQMTNKRR